MERLLLSLLLAVMFTLPAYAQMMDMPMMGPGEGHGPMMGMMHEDMMGVCLTNADKIGLTDEQIKKIKPIHREMQKKRAQFQADLKIAEIDMREIMDVKDFDLEKASAQVKKIADLRTAHHLEMLKAMKEVRAILTEEQFRKMQKFMHTKMAEKKPGKKRMMKK